MNLNTLSWETIFHAIEILVQFFGLFVLLFKGGRWVGEIATRQNQTHATLNSHIDEDRGWMHEHGTKITKLEVGQAVLKQKVHNLESQRGPSDA